jgi:hypothetical protein
MVDVGVPGRLVVVAVLVMSGACSSPDEPEVAPVVCTSDAPMAIDVPVPSEAEIDDTVAATGLDRGPAAQRARMQGIATTARSDLQDADRGYLVLRVDDQDDGLVYFTTEPDLACDRLTEILGGGADGIAVLRAARSSLQVQELLTEVQAELAAAPDELVEMVRVEAETQLVLVEVPIDAGDEVEALLRGLPDDVQDLVVVVETDRVVSEGL